MTEIKCQKTIPEYRQNLLFNPHSPRSPGDELSLSKKMAENFTLFAIEEEIPVQMPKNIELEEQKYNSTNDN